VGENREKKNYLLRTKRMGQAPFQNGASGGEGLSKCCFKSKCPEREEGGGERGRLLNGKVVKRKRSQNSQGGGTKKGVSRPPTLWVLRGKIGKERGSLEKKPQREGKLEGGGWCINGLGPTPGMFSGANSWIEFGEPRSAGVVKRGLRSNLTSHLKKS